MKLISFNLFISCLAGSCGVKLFLRNFIFLSALVGLATTTISDFLVYESEVVFCFFVYLWTEIGIMMQSNSLDLRQKYSCKNLRFHGLWVKFRKLDQPNFIFFERYTCCLFGHSA